MAGFGSIQKELKKKRKRKNTTKLSVLFYEKKKPFFKKREKIRPQKQSKDYNVTEKELWITNDVYV